jgi:hypothetical protein
LAEINRQPYVIVLEPVKLEWGLTGWAKLDCYALNEQFTLLPFA